jgi:hypothetical protein
MNTPTEPTPLTDAATYPADCLGNALVVHRDCARSFENKLSAATTERDQLRAIFPQICAALGNGAFCTPTVSVGFIESIPNEVQLVVAALRAKLERLRSDRDCEKRLRKDADEFREDAIARAARAEADLAFQVARNSDLFTQRDEAFESQEKAETELAVERDQIAQLVITKVKACTAAADNKAEADQWRAKLQRAEREVYRLEGCCGELQSIIDNQGYPSGTDYAKMEARAERAEAEAERYRLVTLRQDADLAIERARLDWLEKSDPDALHWWTVGEPNSIRDDIDAAMKEDEK